MLASEVCLFCNKTINANNKTRRITKQGFCKNTLKKTPSSGKSLIRINSLKWVGWGERLFEFDWEEEGVANFCYFGAPLWQLLPICSNFRFGGQLINVLELMGTIKRTFQTVKVMFTTHEKILKDDF